MKKQKVITKQMVIERLSKNGYNPEEARKMTELHFETATKKSNDLKYICWFISVVY
jgi:hypothetical protein